MIEQKPSFFDVPYAIASTKLTAGTTVVTTTGGDYLGFAILVSSAPVSIIVYNGTATTGAPIDALTVTASTRSLGQIFARARIGLTVVLTGTNGIAAIFYTPKG